MTLEDPFFIVRDEVVKAIIKTRGLYQRWCDLHNEPCSSSKEEVDWVTSELKNSLRSIEWDLEDLDETVSIVEKNPKKFKIEDGEIVTRKGFIESAKQDVENMKEKVHSTKHTKEKKVRPPLLNSSPRYMRLENQLSNPNSPDKEIISKNDQLQQGTVRNQDEQSVLIRDPSDSSQKTNTFRRDEHAIMIDDFAQDRGASQYKLDSAMRKITKVMNMSSDRIQWMAIGTLSGVMVLVLILFFML